MRKTYADEIPFHRRLLPARAVADRYGTHLRTISRWVGRGIIPPPDEVICERRYWLLETLEQADRARTIAAAAKAKSNPDIDREEAPKPAA